MISVGPDSQVAKCYIVRDGYLVPTKPIELLGQFLKFNAVDEDSFEGPIETTMEEVRKKYGPVKSASYVPPERLGE